MQQQGVGGKEATTTLPGRSEQGNARDQAGVQDDNSQQQVRQTCRRFLLESGLGCLLFLGTSCST